MIRLGNVNGRDYEVYITYREGGEWHFENDYTTAKAARCAASRFERSGHDAKVTKVIECRWATHRPRQEGIENVRPLVPAAPGGRRCG